MVTSWAVSQIDLSDPGFWGRPFGERDAAFELLRRERPVAFFPEPAVPSLPPGPGFWALTRHEDVAMASREPGLFSSAPGSVLPARPPNPHLGYGGPGPHYCLGAHLARAEIQALFRALFTRMPDLQVTGDPHWLRSSSINGIKHLPVRYTPSRPRA